MKLYSYLFAILSLALTTNVSGQEIKAYQIGRYNVVDDYTNLIGETITYIPQKVSQGITYGEYGNWEGFGKRAIPLAISNIKVQKKNKNYTKMIWTIFDEYGMYMTNIIVYAGNYTKYISSTRHEYFINDLPLFYIDNYIQDKSSAIGEVYTHPKVKATYKVVGLSYVNEAIGITPDEGYQLAYVVRNSLTGDTKLVEANDAQRWCFSDDLTEGFHSYLSKVEKPSDPSVRYGDTTSVIEDGLTKYTYIDDYIDITIMCNEEGFDFIIRNVSSSTIKIIWDDAVFVGYDGHTSKIIHSGVNYDQIGNSQTPTTIIKDAILEETVCPISNIEYNEINKDWYIASMYPPIGVKNNVSHVSLMLPIQIMDVINEYVFVFDITYGYDHLERLNQAK